MNSDGNYWLGGTCDRSLDDCDREWIDADEDGIVDEGEWDDANINGIIDYEVVAYEDYWVFDMLNLEDYWWDTANSGVRLMQVCFYPLLSNGNGGA